MITVVSEQWAGVVTATSEQIEKARRIVCRLRALDQSWRTVASALNDAGYRTTDGADFGGRDVQALGWAR
jgi:hypothetical protein